MTIRAERRIFERCDEIEAALFDLRPTIFGIFGAQRLEEDSLLQRRYRNRLMSALLLLYHLKDDVRRLAKRRGVLPTVVDNFVASSKWVTLCVRAGDTHKPGLGGRSRNATIPNGLLKVVKTAPSEPPSPKSDAIEIGMIVADADHGAFHSKSILDGAVRDWVRFFATNFNLDLASWELRCVPPKRGPIIRLQHGENPSVPMGAILEMELPLEIQAGVVADISKRRHSNAETAHQSR